MKYIVQEEYQLPEDADWEIPEFNGALLYPGDEVWDGEIEPDIVARLVSKGVLVPADQVGRVPDEVPADPPDEDAE